MQHTCQLKPKNGFGKFRDQRKDLISQFRSLKLKLRWVPAKLSSSLVEGTLSRKRCKEVLSERPLTVGVLTFLTRGMPNTRS